MKNSYSILMILVILGLISCKNESSKSMNQTTQTQENKLQKSAINILFEGSWTRKFSMGNGTEQQVFYTISEDKIEYKMQGAMSINYSIIKDTFISKNNRWIGKKDSTQYVIFAKNITKDSISLFKKKTKNLEEALSTRFPSDTTRSQFTSWNVFKKVN